jgi:hypothetical protein
MQSSLLILDILHLYKDRLLKVYYFSMSDNPIDDIGSFNKEKIIKMATRYSESAKVKECLLEDFKGVLLSTHWNGG